MSEKIVQRFGFEAGSAISTINKIQESLGKLNTKIRAFNKAASAGDTGKVTAQFDKVGESARKAGEKVAAANKKAGNSAKDVTKVTFAWSGLVKALVARTAVQAITALTGAIKDSAAAAADFEMSVARISNIAKGPGDSIDDLTVSLSEMAVELGRTQDEVTNAAFEALQNDLGSTADTMDLLSGAAHNLSAVTGGTLGQSINSLSSVLKAYNMDIGEADKVSDQFFAAIDKGRITLAELENSLGKITPLAAKLDIEFGQVAGAMAAITQSGTSASVANTQLRSIMQKLIRPTEELQGAFDSLGVKTFNELINQSGSLQTALTQIATSLGNDDRAIAKAFGRLRGQLGVFNLLANEGKVFTDTMDAVNNSTGKAAAGAAVISATSAKRSQIAWAKFDETMRQVGESVLYVETVFIETFSKIIPSGNRAVRIIQALASSMAVLGAASLVTGIMGGVAAIAALGAAATAASISMGLLTLAALAGVAIGEAWKATHPSYNTLMEKIDETSKAAEKSLHEDTKKSLKSGNKAVSDLLEDRGTTVDKYIAGLSAAFKAETAEFQAGAKITQGALEGSISDFTSGMDSAISDMKSKLKGLNNSLLKAQSNQKSAKQELEDFRFDKNQSGKTSFQKLDNYMSRANDQARKLKKSMSGALSNPGAVDSAQADIDRLKKLADELISKSGQIKNPVKASETRSTGENLKEKALKAQVDLENKKILHIKSLATATESLLNKQKAITNELRIQLELASQQADIYDQGGLLKSEDTQASDKASMEETKSNIRDLVSQFDAGLFKTFGKKEIANKLIKNISTAFNNAEFEYSNIRSGIEAKINEAPFKVFVDIASRAGNTGNSEIDARINDAKNSVGGDPVASAEAARKEIAAILKEQKKNQILYDEQVSLGQLKQLEGLNRLEVATSEYSAKSIESARSVTESIGAMQDKLLDPNTTAAEVAILENQWNSLRGKLEGLIDDEKIGEDFGKSMREVLSALEEQIYAKGFEISLKPKFDTEVIKNLEGQLRDSFGAGTTGADETNTAVGTLNASLGGTVTMARSAALEMNQLAVAAEAAARASAVATSNKYHGGQVAYRAAGGPTRGLDTQLTATSPGEYITNSRSSRQFFSELQAINAGQSPQYRDKGGSVTNNIGDINVNVTGDTSAPTGLGRSIASELRRELRRRTSTL